MPLDLSCSENQRILCTLAPTKSNGDPASVEGAATVTVQSGPALIQMVDDLSFYVRANGVAGPSAILVQADADLGSGVSLIQDTISLNVVAEMATSLGLTAGAAEADPDL